MKQFEFLEHTGDTKFKAFGKNLEESFSNAALAMFSIMVDYTKVRPKLKHKIKIKGSDLKSLLYNWLEELLFLVDAKSFLLNKVESIKIDNKKFILEAIVIGDKAENYETIEWVKAPTYHDMEITNKHVQVVLDL